ncbi:MAG: ABC transporter permease [Bacteroidetes bacterium]|nr:ABC transporter permease [Bacteroidota bacterium]MBK9523499.1 ABC transporter permease [Bacteroidota bacterium]MBK9541245.1 ABC transporter permease [Bacteroidota bacterium]MBL0258878.1 ABC transporter permease [Bacteroidota bacterium]MBP6648869.1 ABC transporter permease [Bacteroidia bacterium]
MSTRFWLFIRLFRESFLFAFESLRVNKLRSILSLLGITIGIFAIIAIFTATDALETKIRADVATLGNNVIYIQKWPWVPEDGGDEYPWWKYMNRPLPGIKEMNEIQRKAESADVFSYVATINNQTIKYESNSIENALVLCVSHQYDKIKVLEIKDGRYFTENESNSGKPLALIGADIESGLFPKGDAIGKSIIIRGFKLNIIGVVKKEGSSMVGNSSDNQVIVPVNFARNLVNLKSDNVDPFVMVKAKEGISNIELRDDLRGGMRSIRKLKPKEEDDFALNETSLLSNGLKDLFRVLSIVGWILGGLSILVGGFSIANIMFVSVRERTPIIGIQKSLGAKSYFILLQFLVEAIVLCIFGGCIGLILVFLVATGATALFEFDFALTLSNISMGLLISASIGIISGIIPALRAAQMNPVDAIRAS